MPARSETTAITDAQLPATVDLHARPAADFVRAAMGFEADVRVEHGGQVANAKSLMAVLALGAKGGAGLRLSAEGDDAGAAVEALAGASPASRSSRARASGSTRAETSPAESAASARPASLTASR